MKAEEWPCSSIFHRRCCSSANLLPLWFLGTVSLLLIQKLSKLRCLWQSLSKILMVIPQGQKALQLHLHQGYSAGPPPQLEEVVSSVQPTQEHCCYFFFAVLVLEGKWQASSYQLFYKAWRLWPHSDCYVGPPKKNKQKKQNWRPRRLFKVWSSCWL